MANFLIIVDPEPERRSHFIQMIEPLLPPVEGLITNSCTSNDFHAIWAAHPSAPVSWVASPEGAAVVWGEAIIPGESTRINAESLRNIWKESANQTLPPFDGFYAAVAYHPHYGVTVTADILGLFPIYYYTDGNVALVASSPELFRYHPRFKAEFNPAGLVGILLTNGVVSGQTLWQDVQRLDAGHALIWQPEKTPKEAQQYEIPNSTPDESLANLAFSEHLDLVEQLLSQTLKRHAPVGQNYSLLLSGGLDSRMLAGFLHEQGINPVALTLGKRSDLEMKCAVPVARCLGLQHHTANIPFENYPNYAQTLMQWEHLTNGSNCIMDWGIHTHLNHLAPRAVAGYLLDRVIGGKATYSLSISSLSFETFFNEGANRWGFRPEILEKLLSKEVFDGLVPHTLDQIQTVYNSYAQEEFKRAWWFELRHRQRFHVGCAAWQACFGGWPVLPVLDLQLLNTAAILPESTLAERRVQKELVCTRFPKLAALPLDRNDYDVEPLKPSQLRSSLARLYRLQRRWRRFQQKLGIEPRYYFRIYDINNPGWQEVRRQAEPYRPLVRHLFDETIFDSLVSPPDVPIQLRRDPITEASAIKAMLGFLLWSKEHL
ncbi:MAG TPA: asparagine synthase-related protein [Waterburya sp.]|jgi:asparagine synthase (glutamine-hydrolysing)